MTHRRRRFIPTSSRTQTPPIAHTDTQEIVQKSDKWFGCRLSMGGREVSLTLTKKLTPF